MLLVLHVGALGQEAPKETVLGATPAKPVGKKTENGFTVTSAPDHFEIDLPGRQFRALSQDRLLWDVDGLRVELLIVRRPAFAASLWTAEDAIRKLEVSTDARDSESIRSAGGPRGRIWVSSHDVIGAAEVRAGVVILKAIGVDEALRSPVRVFVRRALESLREPDRAMLDRQPPISQAGAPLQEQLRIAEALSGKPFVAVLNSKLASSADAKIAGSVQLDAPSIVDFARMLLGLGYTGFTVTVFDGRVAHAINLRGYDFVKDAFQYWDPWGKGSFLENGNNAVGVTAVPHHFEQRLWVVPFADLERVLYAVVVQERSVVEALRLCTLIAGAPRDLAAAYVALAADDSSKDSVTVGTLEAYARHLFRVDLPEAAAAILAVRLSVDSKPLEIDLIELARKNGVNDLQAKASKFLHEVGVSPNRQPRTPQSREDAISHDFFKFFHLQQISVENDTTVFRPRADQFRSLVNVQLSVDGNDHLTKREMVIKHKFVTDRVSGVFARDFTKSFILFAVDPSDIPTARLLSDEIFGSKPRRVAIPGAIRRTASVPALPSLGAMTYQGFQRSFKVVLPTSVLQLRNVGERDTGELIVTVTPR